jgi:glycosyltransferase involved in cell wall biosynthesis
VRTADVVIGTSPHLFTAGAAFIVGRMKGIPFVFELRDLWPESIKAVGAMKDGPILRFLERAELFLYRKAALVITVTQAFKRNLVSRGVDPEKIHVVTNGVDLSRFKPQQKDPDLEARYGLEGKFVVGYVGTLGMAHALETLLEAAWRLAREPTGDRFRLLLLGDGACKEALQRKAREIGLDNVIFLDSVPKQKVVRFWSLLDVAVIHLKKIELFTTVVPSKLFEAMAMGIPVLHGVAGESAEIVENEGVGLVFEPENVTEFCESVMRIERDRTLLENLRARCLKAAPRYDRTGLARDMLTIIETGIAVSVAALSAENAN